MAENKRLAAVRVRGLTGIRKDIMDTLNMLRLHRKNYCIVLLNTPSATGMIKKVKDYITWGEIDEETYKLLFEKRGEEYKERLTDAKKKLEYKNKYIVFNKKRYKKFFRLSPPRGGFERKGIKKAFSVGGALGYRGEKISELIKKMV